MTPSYFHFLSSFIFIQLLCEFLYTYICIFMYIFMPIFISTFIWNSSIVFISSLYICSCIYVLVYMFLNTFSLALLYIFSYSLLYVHISSYLSICTFYISAAPSIYPLYFFALLSLLLNTYFAF